MLTHLSIRNIVLIDTCELAFAEGLCVLTGETGAGKSILLDSLGLALGSRSDAGLVRHGETAGTVMAEFDIAQNARAQAVLAELGLENADSVIIRRALGADGKTRCFVNDEPVSVGGLKKLGETLIEVHGQHDQKGLLDQSTHRGLLDEYGRLEPYVAEVSAAYRTWRETKEQLRNLEEELERSKREEEYLRHLAEELKKLNPQAGEETKLAETRAEMMASEKLFSTIDDAISELSKDKGASSAIRSAQRVLLRSSLHSTGKLADVIDALERAATETDEAQAALENLARESAFDPRKLDSIEERLFALKAAGRKYNMPVDELSTLQEEAEGKLKALDSREKELARLTEAQIKAKELYAASAAKLSKSRAKAAVNLEKAILAELEPLKMGGTKIRIRLESLAENAWSGQGAESVAFEVATNVGRKADVPFSPLHKVASGGELSRLMLALKVTLSEIRSTPTLIFDEIDTGTGGAVADAIGQRLGVLGSRAQVMVVTHMPQVAAKGKQHLRVSKQEIKGAVTTSVETLSEAERKEELARMLAGASITAEARKAAEKLLEDAA